MFCKRILVFFRILKTLALKYLNISDKFLKTTFKTLENGLVTLEVEYQFSKKGLTFTYISFDNKFKYKKFQNFISIMCLHKIDFEKNLKDAIQTYF